jgi:hypothetical protein
MIDTEIEERQRRVCMGHGAPFVAASVGSTVGIAFNVRDGLMPLNGLRLTPVGETNGWYIWAGGEPSPDPDYFHPLHVEHIDEWCPAVQKYLGLPPGWRFLVAGEVEDVWYDDDLLSSEQKVSS